MKTIVVILARGGSKRIPLKNIKPLAGKPLIAYLIDAALKAKTIDRVIVSTDHPEIIRISREYGAEVPFVRPKDISEDVASELATQHAVKYLETNEGYKADIVVTLQPTVPFLLPKDIDGCVNMLVESDADSVFTACEIKEHPEWMYSIDDNGYIRNYVGGIVRGDMGVSQNLEKLYMPNGGAYATRKDVLFEQDAIIGKKSKIWIMPIERSIDIDEPIELEFAELMAIKFKKEGII